MMHGRKNIKFMICIELEVLSPTFKTPFRTLFWATSILSTLSHNFRSPQLGWLQKTCLFAVFLKEFCRHFPLPYARHASHSFHSLWFASEFGTMKVSFFLLLWHSVYGPSPWQMWHSLQWRRSRLRQRWYEVQTYRIQLFWYWNFPSTSECHK